MNNGTSLSFLVYVIYNESIWKCKGIRAEALTGITGVEEIYIPANITWIEPGALEKLENLMYIEVAPDNPAYQSIDGVLYSKKEQKEKA